MNTYELKDNVLGMLMSDSAMYWPIALENGFDPEAFGDLPRIAIAKSIQKVMETNAQMDVSVLIDMMNGENAHIVKVIWENAPIAQNFSWFCSQVMKLYRVKKLCREVSDVVFEINSLSDSDPIDFVIHKLLTYTDKIKEHQTDEKSSFKTKESMDSSLSRLEDRIVNRDDKKFAGYKTGLSRIDEGTSGLIGGRFYIIAARTSVGKTTFASHICFETMKQGAKTLFFSNEMDKEDLIEKFLSSQAKIHSLKLQVGDLNDSEQARLVKAADEIVKLNITIDEKAGWDLDKLLASIYKHHREKNCDIVFVDYLQQVRVRNVTNKHEQVSIVSDAMKKISRDLNIPVVGLAQINREAEKNGNSFPSLSNLKDSGSLEQDADVVMILHKEKLADEFVTLMVAKNRYGRTGPLTIKHVQAFNYYEQV